MIAAKRAWSLYKRKKAAFLTWPMPWEKNLKVSLGLENLPSFSSSKSPKINHKTPLIHSRIIWTYSIYNNNGNIWKFGGELLDHVHLEIILEQ